MKELPVMDFDNFDLSDVSAGYDRVTGPTGALIRVFTISSPDGYVEGTLRLRVEVNGLLDALVIECRRKAHAFDDTTFTRTIRWAAIESLVVLDENPEN